MNIKQTAIIVAKSAGGNPATATITVMLFYCAFNFLEATIERLIFGERFEHWLDPIFVCMFIAYAATTVYACALLRIKS